MRLCLSTYESVIERERATIASPKTFFHSRTLKPYARLGSRVFTKADVREQAAGGKIGLDSLFDSLSQKRVKPTVRGHILLFPTNRNLLVFTHPRLTLHTKPKRRDVSDDAPEPLVLETDV